MPGKDATNKRKRVLWTPDFISEVATDDRRCNLNSNISY